MTAAQQHDITIDKIHPTNKCQPQHDAHRAMQLEDDDDCVIHCNDAYNHRTPH